MLARQPWLPLVLGAACLTFSLHAASTSLTPSSSGAGRSGAVNSGNSGGVGSRARCQQHRSISYPTLCFLTRSSLSLQQTSQLQCQQQAHLLQHAHSYHHHHHCPCTTVLSAGRSSSEGKPSGKPRASIKRSTSKRSAPDGAAKKTPATATGAAAAATPPAPRSKASLQPAARRKQVYTRKPPGYWLKAANMQQELKRFWRERGVDSDCVPSYLLLQYFGEGGMASGIAQWGGGEQVANRLGVQVMPGRWSAASQLPEVQGLISAGHLSPESAAVGPYGGAAGLIRHGTARYDSVRLLLNAREARQRVVKPGKQAEGRKREGYKPRGYWADYANLQRELFGFLSVYQPAVGQPVVWVPRKIDFEQAGRGDIAQAICKYGGAELIAARYGLVPHSNWGYFDRYLSVLKELQAYIERYGTPGFMPRNVDMERNGYSKLCDGIAWCGGAKMLAAKLDMRLERSERVPRAATAVAVASPPPINGAGGRPTQPGPVAAAGPAAVAAAAAAAAVAAEAAAAAAARGDGVVWGDFDLDFAVDLLEYVKSQSYGRTLGEPSAAVRRGEAPPSWDSNIAMPFRYDLLADRQTQLVLKIEEFGGFENVARRLQLVYEDRKLKELKRLHASAAIQYRAARARQLTTALRSATGGVTE